MKIAVLNSVALNGGDAAIVYGTCDAVRQQIPDAEITVFCHSAQHVRRYYTDLQIREMFQDAWPGLSTRDRVLRRSFAFRHRFGFLSNRERSFFRTVRSMDAVLYVGGGYVSDNYGTRNLLRMMAGTAEGGVPHMAYAQSFGPFHREETVLGLKQALGRFDTVTTRDEASLNLLKSIGIAGPSLSFTADAAFSMRPFNAEELPIADRRAADEIAQFRARGSGNKVLLVSVRDWKFPNRSDGPMLEKRARAEIMGFAEKVLEETDWKLCFLSTCQGRPHYNFDDSRTAAVLLRDLPDRFPDRSFICSHPFHPRSYPFVIERCADLVVTMRMHMAILSILAGTPFIALAYEQKSRELARQVGIEDYCFDLGDIDAGSLFRTFVKAVGTNEGLRVLLRKALPELRERSLENAKILAAMIER